MAVCLDGGLGCGKLKKSPQICPYPNPWNRECYFTWQSDFVHVINNLEMGILSLIIWMVPKCNQVYLFKKKKKKAEVDLTQKRRQRLTDVATSQGILTYTRS